MKSVALHKFLAFYSLLIACAWGQLLNQQQQPQVQTVQRPVFFINHNIRPEDAKNYQITVPSAPKAGEPCLTISWKSNPDGSEPALPQIYMGNGYFGILPPTVVTQQRT
ncbi:hypothetical protein KR074_011352 [Drosophila pseudoananassae]|nr:hypothetical protein KR074_011352 [Drosophila pseudoananassae]